MKRILVELTPAEYEQIIWCVGNFTDANARDGNEMRKCGVTNPRALLRAQAKIEAAATKVPPAETVQSSLIHGELERAARALGYRLERNGNHNDDDGSD